MLSMENLDVSDDEKSSKNDESDAQSSSSSLEDHFGVSPKRK
jgi:hypothetical protein